MFLHSNLRRTPAATANALLPSMDHAYNSSMVYLSRIYTKSGDHGETGLGDGTRVPKDHPRVVAYGMVDELNAVLGLLLTANPSVKEAELLRSIQNDLFDVGADLCTPQAVDEQP